jgi:hypothetical protein
MKVFLAAVLFLAIGVLGMCVRILLKKDGRFPQTDVGENEAMRRLGIRCMKEGARRSMSNRYIKEPLADYLAEGMTTANHKASLKERFRIMAKHYGCFTAIAQHIWFIFRAFIKK